MANVAIRSASAVAVARSPRSLWAEIWRHRLEYLFISPFFIIYGFFHLYPLCWAFYLSFQRWSGFGDMKFVGLDNYRAVLTETVSRAAFGNTVIFTTSFGYMEQTLKAAKSFPKVQFYHSTGFKSAPTCMMRALLFQSPVW